MTKESVFVQNVREYLEWSWNYGAAEELAQNSTKGMARLIEGSGGILAGADATDEKLVEAFLSDRIADLKTLKPEEGWVPEPGYHKFTLDELIVTLRSFVGIDEILHAFRLKEEKKMMTRKKLPRLYRVVNLAVMEGYDGGDLESR